MFSSSSRSRAGSTAASRNRCEPQRLQFCRILQALESHSWRSITYNVDIEGLKSTQEHERERKRPRFCHCTSAIRVTEQQNAVLYERKIHVLLRKLLEPFVLGSNLPGQGCSERLHREAHRSDDWAAVQRVAIRRGAARPAEQPDVYLHALAVDVGGIVLSLRCNTDRL